MQDNFVHLRLHTEYSIVDGLVRIKPLVSKLVELNMPAVAITDEVNLFALIKFYTATMGAGIKPICGCDINVQSEEDPDKYTSLVLLVKNELGYRNLTELVSRAYTEKITHGAVQVKKAWVRKHREGLIALSGARKGDVGVALLDNEPAHAGALLRSWMECFPESFYLELQIQEIAAH